MTNALQELHSFTQFAQKKLSESDATLSLEECIRLWRQQVEMEETVEDVRLGRKDFEAGLAVPLDEAMADIRRQLGWTP
jgi:hypothetical protein